MLAVPPKGSPGEYEDRCLQGLRTCPSHLWFAGPGSQVYRDGSDLLLVYQDISDISIYQVNWLGNSLSLNGRGLG
jgi:hypothetical protein